MNKWSLMVLLAAAVAVRAELTPDPNAQQQAVTKYPALSDAGSDLNRRFVEKVRQAREHNAQILNDPRWPLLIAEAAAKELGIKPVEAAYANTGALNAPAGGRLQKFVKMTAAEVATSPFSLENAMVEMTKMERVEIKEESKGVYEVTVWGHNGDYLVGTLPLEQASAAQRSKTLFISISEARKYGSRIIIHGNAANYAGLSTVPTVGWR